VSQQRKNDFAPKSFRTSSTFSQSLMVLGGKSKSVFTRLSKPSQNRCNNS